MLTFFVQLDGCESEMLENGEWPTETDLGDYGNRECPCSGLLDSSATVMAIGLCEGEYTAGARWNEQIDTSMCAVSLSPITDQLCQAALVS